MPKTLYLNIENEERLFAVARALASKDRIKILNLLDNRSYNIAEIAELLHFPPSTTAFHMRLLEQAGLIHTEQHPGNHGSMKLCSRKQDEIYIHLTGSHQNTKQVVNVPMPIGAYTDCRIFPTCGLADINGHIGQEDTPGDFFLPERFQAQILWSAGGFVEYRFPCVPFPHRKIKQLMLSFEACSEAPNYRETWKSDITIWMNGVDCGTWTSPGDLGARRGKLNPAWWPDGSTQYGLLVTLLITESKAYINNEEQPKLCLANLHLEQNSYITVKIGNKEHAEFSGGFNLFGRKFGDYEQDINLSFIY